MSLNYKQISRYGIWDNNVVFAQMLTLCPLLAVTGTATNGLGKGRAEFFASRNSIRLSVFDGLMMGLGFTLSLVMLGAAREIIGSGTLFTNASLLLGSGIKLLELAHPPAHPSFLRYLWSPTFISARNPMVNRAYGADHDI